MKKLYVASDPTDAHLLKGLLDGEGIDAEVRGEHLYLLRGHIPMTEDIFPSVWIRDDAEFARAEELLSAFEEGPPASPEAWGAWRCRCGSENEAGFTDCWSCGGARHAGSSRGGRR